MSFEVPEWADPRPWLDTVARADARMVRQALAAEDPGPREMAALLSPAAACELETMAQRALALTRRHFGRTISLFAPLYLSNHCSSDCTYCGFSLSRDIAREQMTGNDMDIEMAALRSMGIQETLLLTGDRIKGADYKYLRDGVARAASQFHNVTVEVFAMSEQEYRGLADAGCTGMTMFQETYDPEVYQRLHTRGPKRDYTWRVNAPSRALAAGFRNVSLGALLGISHPLFDVLALYRHAAYLRHTFWKGGVSICFPRIRPQSGGYTAEFPVDERMLAQIIFAFRICLPDVPLVLSTRESPQFRDGMAGIGISKMSVASRTTVGGYGATEFHAPGQFEVDDDREVEPFCAMLRARGLQPVFKNWEDVYRAAS